MTDRRLTAPSTGKPVAAGTPPAHDALHTCICELASYLARHGGGRDVATLKHLLHDASRVRRELDARLNPNERRALAWVWPSPSDTGGEAIPPEAMAAQTVARLSGLLDELDACPGVAASWYQLRAKLAALLEELGR